MSAEKNTSIPCPTCGTQIEISLDLLLSGKPFSCNNCNTSLSIDSNSPKFDNDEMKKVSENIKNIIGKQP